MAQDKMMRNAFNAMTWSYIDKILNYVVTTLVTVILARLIAPEHYGIISVAMILINFLDAFVETGFNSALVRKKNPDELDYSTMFWFNIVVSTLLYALLYLCAPLVERFWGIDGLTPIIRVLAIKIPVVSVFSIQRVFVQKNFLYKKFCLVSVSGKVIATAVTIAMALSGFGIWALVFNTIIKSLSDMVLSFVIVKWRPVWQFSFSRFKELFSFGKNILLAKMVDVAYVEISGVIMGKKHSATDLALYNRGQTFPHMIMAAVNSSLSEVLFTVLSGLQDEAEKLKETMRTTLRLSNYLLFPLLVGLLSCSESFVGFLLTEQWLACVPYLKLMCIYNMCLPISSAIYQAVKASGKSKVIFLLEIIKKAMGVVFLFTTILLFDDPIFIAGSVLVTMLLSTVMDAIVANRVVKYKFKELFLDVYKIIIANILMGVCVYSVGFFALGYLATLIIQVVIGVAAYILLSILLGINEFNVALNILKRKVVKK